MHKPTFRVHWRPCPVRLQTARTPEPLLAPWRRALPRIATARRSLRSAAALLICIALAGCAKESPPSEPSRSVDLVISGVTIVVPELNTLSEPKDVAIDDGLIAWIDDAGSRTVRAQRTLNGEGFFLLPGLVDAHAHIGDGGMTEQTEAVRIGALKQFLSYGVTTIFVPGGGGGNDDHLKRWKERCSSGELLCPRLLGSGALITAPWSHPIGTIWGFPPDADPAVVYERGAVSLAEDEPAAPLIQHKKALGADAIKIVIEDQLGPQQPMPRLSNRKIAELVAASQEHELKVFAHVSLAKHVADGVAHGVDAIMHSADDPISEPVLSSMAQQNVTYVPTLSLFEGLFARGEGVFRADPYAQLGVSQTVLESLDGPDFAFPGPTMPEEEEQQWKAAIKSNIVRAHAAGVSIALGTDTNNPTVFPGHAAHQELALLVEAGLSPAEALTASTRGSTAMLGLTETVGRVAPGYSADLLLLRMNPLEDVKNTRSLEAVVSQGRVVEPVVSSAGL